MVATIAAGTAASYYTQGTEYYLGGHEPPGFWKAFDPDLGAEDGAEVQNELFERLHAGLGEDGKPLAGSHALTEQRCGGYDLTLSASKSVSVIWALADDETRLAIEAAQRKAVEAALAMLNDEAAFSRRGKGGAILERAQLTAAVFPHGEARPAEHEDGTISADPQLHHHAVILNLARREDGTYGALDGRCLFRHKMAAGAIYHVELAAELEKIGFTIGPTGKNGIFEIEGVDERLRSHFSARREAITEAMAERGLQTSAAPVLAAAITAASRNVKQDNQLSDRHDRWRAEAKSLGFEAESVPAARQRTAPNPHRDIEREIARRMTAIPTQLTETESVFERRDIIAAIASALVGTGVGSDRVTQEVNQLIEAGAIMHLGKDSAGHEKYSTPEMITIERELRDFAQRGSRRRFHGFAAHKIDALLSDSILSGEQRKAVRQAASPLALTVIEGAAGSGKTTALRPLAEAYQGAGYRVVGSATAWKIAKSLGDELGIDSRATDSWLKTAETGGRFLDEKSVLILDEAGQLSSRQMHRVLAEAERTGAKVVLVGDREQLQPIGAGPALSIVVNQVGTTRVDRMIRQREAWARDAAKAFAKGDAAQALGVYAEHGLFFEASGPKRAVEAVVERWSADRAEVGAKGALVLAKTNAQVREINSAIRTRLRSEQAIAGPDHIVKTVLPNGLAADMPFAVGDEIRFLARKDEIGVVNGTTAKIEAIRAAPDGHVQLQARIRDRVVEFSTSQIADEQGRAKITHAYASTIYGAQGLTAERAVVFLEPGFDRHDAYVAASRSKEAAFLVSDQRQVDGLIRAESPLNERAGLTIDATTRRQFMAARLSRKIVKMATLEITKDTAAERKRSVELER